MTSPASELRSTVDAEYARLAAISDGAAGVRPSPGKWSPKEIIGHLIDSASNNHGRFVRAQLANDLVFPGYEQDSWVRVQNYNARRWTELLNLWRALNGHVAAVVESMSPETLSRQRTTHNLDVIAWRTVPPDQPATLDYFVRDYIGHLRHHLSQIP